MTLSHSKLSQIISCPMSYWLNYEVGLKRTETKPALYVGSAVHWGLEHSTEDLSEFFGQSFKTRDSYGHDQLLAEAMVHGYLKQKDNIMNDILTDSRTGEKATLIDEQHELYMTGTLPSKLKTHPNGHDFVGIIDLLLLTDKGFVVIDYKTSTFAPDWDGYLDQIYRYIFLLKANFPDTPIYKIGIVNLRKCGIRQKRNENQEQFDNRLRFEYDTNDELVNYHEYRPEDLNEHHINDYIENLGRMCDTAVNIVDSRLFYINYAAAKGQYGKSDYYDIFYHTPDAYVLYDIADKVFYDDEWHDRRPCVKLDMDIIDDKRHILYKYSDYEKARITNSLDSYEIDPWLSTVYDATYKKLHEAL